MYITTHNVYKHAWVTNNKYIVNKKSNINRSGFFVFLIGKMIQLQVHLQLPCYDFCFLY
jgi:hypothetical protein